MKRAAFTLIVVAVLSSFLPVAYAQPRFSDWKPADAGANLPKGAEVQDQQAVIAFKGSGSATALDITVPALKWETTKSLNLDDKFHGLTVGYSSALLSSDAANPADPAISGMAAGTCDLLSNTTDPLKACSLANAKSSSATKDSPVSGSKDFSCTPITLSVVSLSSACGKSYSSTEGGLQGINEAAVEILNVSLDLSSLGLEKYKDSEIASISGLVSQIYSLSPLTTSQTDALKSSLDGILNSVASGTEALKVKVGASTTDVESTTNTSTIKSTAAAASIGLLGITDALKDGIMMIDVSAGESIATWNNLTGIATAKANDIVATVKVRDLIDLCKTISGQAGLSCVSVSGSPYIQKKVSVKELQSLLVNFNSIPLLATEVKILPRTEDQTGSSVAASSGAIEIHALKGVGANPNADGSAGSNGGIKLRLATSRVEMAGTVVRGARFRLPLTGGPTDLYYAGAGLLALIAMGLVFGARRLARV